MTAWSIGHGLREEVEKETTVVDVLRLIDIDAIIAFATGPCANHRSRSLRLLHDRKYIFRAMQKDI